MKFPNEYNTLSVICASKRLKFEKICKNILIRDGKINWNILLFIGKYDNLWSILETHIYNNLIHEL